MRTWGTKICNLATHGSKFLCDRYKCGLCGKNGKGVLREVYVNKKILLHIFLYVFFCCFNFCFSGNACFFWRSTFPFAVSVLKKTLPVRVATDMNDFF